VTTLKVIIFLMAALLAGCSTAQITKTAPDGSKIEATIVSIGPADSYKADLSMLSSGFEVNGQRGLDLNSLATIVRALIAAGVVVQ
jgi:PBP1b-binding outer membrane lipoprotein LpoB